MSVVLSCPVCGNLLQHPQETNKHLHGVLVPWSPLNFQYGHIFQMFIFLEAHRSELMLVSEGIRKQLRGVLSWVKDPALSLQGLVSLLCCGFDPWAWNFYSLWAWPKPKQTTKKKKKNQS